MVADRGHSWKDIAKEMNKRFDSDDLSHKFGRTPENVKDKWKQLGGEAKDYRKKGPWSLNEALDLLENICTATDTKLMHSNTKVNLAYL